MCSSSPYIKYINYNISKVSHEKDNKKRHFIQLNKGQFCNEDSYSAFNYHTTIVQKITQHPVTLYNFHSNVKTDINKNVLNKNGTLTTYDNEDIDSNIIYSTGLWEYIIEYVNEKKVKPNKLNITVCGLVGNICVIHTILQGIHTWKSFYEAKLPNIETNFIYDISGTLFLPDYEEFGAFKTLYNKEDFDNIDLKTKFCKYFDKLRPIHCKHAINFDVKYNNTHLFKYTSDLSQNFNKLDENKNNLNKYIKYKQKYLNISV